jgi:hypothetical protein
MGDEMKLILTVFASVLALAAAAEARGVQICYQGICVERDSDGRGVDVTPRYPDRGYYPPPPAYYPPPYYPPRSGYTQFLRCESIDGRYQSCYFDDFRVDRIFLHQVHSRAACIYGRTWGVNRGQIWVANGCRATFRIDYW